MSIESLARDAAADLRGAASGVDVGAVLDWLEPANRRRRRRAVLAAALVTVVVGAVAFAAVRPAAHTAEPGRGPTSGNGCPAPLVGLRPLGRGEQLAGFTCLGGRTFRADLVVPLTFELPPTFAADINVGHGDGWQVGLDRLRAGTADERTFVHVAERVVSVGLPVTSGGALRMPDPTAGTTPRSLALWLSRRPFVTAATVTATTLAGHAAYRVDLTGSGAPAPGGGPELPVLTDSAGAPSGLFTVWPGLHVRVWLLDLPGTGLAVVWSQSPRGAADLAVNDAVVEGLRFDR